MSEKPKIHPPLDYIPAEILCARDYEALAHSFVLPDRLAYIAGGSGQDITLERNLRAFDDYAIYPNISSNFDSGCTTLTLFDQAHAHPLMLAPVAYQTLVHPQGELASAEAAESTDTCITTSTLSSYTLEEIAAKAGDQRWFQLYMQADWRDTETLLERAQAAGYRAIVVTVDAAIQVPSIRAWRAGFRFPQDVGAANLHSMPRNATTEEIKGPNKVFQTYRRNAVPMTQLEKLVSQTSLPVIVKGVLNPADAFHLKELGVAGLVVSNHGGRTLDGVPASLRVLPDIRARVGEGFPLLFDGGIRSGNDAFKALALGANAVMIGRLQIYALAVAGALGVAHLLKLLREELELAMATSGCSRIEAIPHSRLYHY